MRMQVGGVIRRIGERYRMSGTRGYSWIPSEPGIWAGHGTYQKKRAAIRKLQGPVFLMSWVRHPVDRCLSSYYMHKVRPS